MQRIKEINAGNITSRQVVLATAAACAGAYGTRKFFECAYPKICKRIFGKKHNENSKINLDFPSASKEGRRRTGHPAVDYEFLRQLYKLIRIILPGIFTKEFAFLSLHSVALVARTFLSIYVAALDGRLARSIVQKDVKKFLVHMSKWIGVSVPCSFVNSLLRYLERKLGLAFRNRLANYSYKLYFKNQTYYKIGNLDSRLVNPDECITEDLRLFCDSVAHLYSHVTKPLLDIVVISFTLRQLAMKRNSSWVVPLSIATLVTFCTSEILKGFSPRFGKLVADESQKRGYLRYIHSRVITNSEEIAFYGGHEVMYELYLFESCFCLVYCTTNI